MAFFFLELNLGNTTEWGISELDEKEQAKMFNTCLVFVSFFLFVFVFGLTYNKRRNPWKILSTQGESV